MTARIGVYVCECGNNISDQVDMVKLLEQLSLPGVVKVSQHRLMCSKEGQDFLEEEIRKERLTHLVVAACSPHQHLSTFMEVCERGGLNPHLMQMANIREQCAWITPDREEATEKAARMIKAAIRRVTWQSPLSEREVSTNPDVLIVGAGRSGMTAALMIASPERQVHLVERTVTLNKTVSLLGAGRPLAEMMAEDPQIIKHLQSELKAVRGFFGNFEVDLVQGNERTGLKVGAIVLCTGSRTMTKEEMGYPGSENPRAMTLPDAPNGLVSRVQALGPGSPKVVFVHCAGREKVGYCSGNCCLRSFQAMRSLMKEVPDVHIIGLYQDVCVPGREGQRYFEGTVKDGVTMAWGRLTGLEGEGGGCLLRYDSGSGAEERISADLVVLVPATVPASGHRELAEITGVTMGPEGFVSEGHEKLEPVATSSKGIYMAGSASGPRDERSTDVLSLAVIAQVRAELVPGKTLHLEPKTSQVCETLCTGCRNCLSVCTYGAIIYDPVAQVCRVNEVICRGCGNCMAACPSGAISVKGATYDQIVQEIREAVR
ncbi:MAG: FAD-dependent oxidoreductase [Methanomassiliicoccales archaeon]|nr:FAD-dependent oxidoreductase [Methanomassiliicoccales archaeon]